MFISSLALQIVKENRKQYISIFFPILLAFNTFNFHLVAKGGLWQYYFQFINTFASPVSTERIKLILILLFQINQSTYPQKVCGSKAGRHYSLDTFINPKAQKDSEGCRVLLTLHYRVINTVQYRPSEKKMVFGLKVPSINGLRLQTWPERILRSKSRE